MEQQGAHKSNKCRLIPTPPQAQVLDTILSRCRKCSNRRRKAVQLLAKAHQKVRRQRSDFHHTEAVSFVPHYDTIYDEELQAANMAKHYRLAKSITDAGWSACLTILAFKAECAGRRAVAAPPAFTSQTCSGCGSTVAKGLTVRWYSCQDCGASLHWDHDAARNILAFGKNQCAVGRTIQASTKWVATCVG
jgi:putative transposase